MLLCGLLQRHRGGGAIHLISEPLCLCVKTEGVEGGWLGVGSEKKFFWGVGAGKRVKIRFEPYFTGVRRGLGAAKKSFNLPLEPNCVMLYNILRNG